MSARSRGSSRREPFVPPAEEEGYRGPARVVAGETDLAVVVDLMDHFEPLDGRTHWYGRIQATPDLAALKDGGVVEVELVIGDVSAPLRLAEYDPWGNVAVRAIGAPPYADGPVSVGD